MVDLRDPTLCPQEICEALSRYVEQFIPTGSFLEAVLSHDLFEAMARADHQNLFLLPAIVSYVYNYLPSNCHGSAAIYEAWCARFQTPEQRAGDRPTAGRGI